MADASRALKVRCQCKIGGEDRYVSGFVAEMEVNRFWPKITVETHQKKDAHTRAIKLGSFDVAKEMGTLQKKVFDQRSSEDFNFNASVQGDSDGGTLTFKGYVIGSEFTITANSVVRADSAIADYAKISALNFDSARTVTYAQEDEGPRLEGKESIATFISKCAEDLLKDDGDGGDEDKSLDTTFRELQKEVNKEVFPKFKELLQASEKTFGWEDAVELISEGKCGDDSPLRARIYGILGGSANGSFESTLMQLAEEFQCIYVPEWDKVGKLLNRRDILKNPEKLSMTIVSLNLKTTNGETLFPVKFIAISPPQQVEYCMEAISDFMAVPKENVKPGASMLRSDGPLWISPAEVMDEIAKEGDEAPRRAKPQKVKKAKKRAKKRKKKKAKEKASLHKILEKYGEALYVYQALSGSFAEIVTTLRLDVEIGKCYRVSSEKGKELFTGVLWGVRHVASTGNGNQPQASTTLNFHIVQMTGFELPAAPK